METKYPMVSIQLNELALLLHAASILKANANDITCFNSRASLARKEKAKMDADVADWAMGPFEDTMRMLHIDLHR